MALIDTLKVNCRKASVLIERREMRPLGPLERTGLWFHLRICNGCKAYEKHSAIIDRWLEERRDGDTPVDADALCDRILRRIGLPR